MATYSVSLDVAAAVAEPVVCPGCGAETLVRHRHRALVSYGCEHCQACWSPHSGHLTRTSPESCGLGHDAGEGSEGVALPRQGLR